jgi:hypothetical protein
LSLTIRHSPESDFAYSRRVQQAIGPAPKVKHPSGILQVLNLNPHPLQKRKTQRVRHPERRSVARLKSGVRWKVKPPVWNFEGAKFKPAAF